MDRRRISLLCAAGATALALAGCTSASTSGTPGPSGGSVPPTGAATAASATATPGAPSGSGASVLDANGADDGRTLTLHVGQRLHVDLPTPFWTFQAVGAPLILRVEATAWASPSASCGPPMGVAGCGDQTADYTAVGPGRTTVVATREECGEAARCTGSAGRFELRVTVTG